MIWVCFPSVITSQLSMFISWKRVTSMLHPWGRSRTTMHTPPCATSARLHAHWQAHHVVSQPAATISLVSDLGLRQYHQVESNDLYLLDGLRDPVPPAVANVEGPKGYYPGERHPPDQWQWCHVEVVPAINYRSGEKNWNIGWVSQNYVSYRPTEILWPVWIGSISYQKSLSGRKIEEGSQALLFVW